MPSSKSFGTSTIIVLSSQKSHEVDDRVITYENGKHVRGNEILWTRGSGNLKIFL